MDPVKRAHHNFVYEGPTDDIGDLSGFKGEGEFTSHWRPNSDDLAVLVEGGDIELTVQAEPLPPVSVTVLAPHDPLPLDPSIEMVLINDEQYRVPPAVVEEINDLRQGVGDKLITFEARPEDTIIVTMPDTASKEMTEAIMGATAAQFPESRVAILPESLGLHRKANFTELLECATEMMISIKAQGTGDLDAVAKGKEAAEAFERLVSG